MRMKQQRGGTLLGFIIGLVVGLAVALAVAVYVTKVPIPFINKGQTRNAGQDVEETKKNKDWDPNAPLYGKNPAKPAAPVASAPLEATNGVVAPSPAVVPAAKPAHEPAVAPAVKPAPEAAGVPAAAPKVESKPAASADPLGDLAKARVAAGTADPFVYFVQLGAFRSAEDAESQRVKLSLGGVQAKVTEREQAGRVVFRVRLGPFDKKEDADKAKERMDATGQEAALVRAQR
jgi:cell division protein FtsN